MTEETANLAKDKGFHKDDDNDMIKLFKSEAKSSINMARLDKEIKENCKELHVDSSKYFGLKN